MVILFKPKLIRLFNLKTKTDESAESPESVHKLFLDPSGKHLIISTESNELYYYSRATKKFKSISKYCYNNSKVSPIRLNNKKLNRTKF